MYPWKVVGYESMVNDAGEESFRLYVVRDMMDPPEGAAGVETDRLYYKSKYVKYVPEIGDLIVAVKGRFGIQEIAVVGRG